MIYWMHNYFAFSMEVISVQTIRKLLHRWCIAVLAVVMIFSIPVSAAESMLSSGKRPFTDVVRHRWYYDYVYSAYDQGVFSGMNAYTFGVNSPMTRAMMVTVLYSMDGKPAVSSAEPFQDVDSSHYYAAPVAWAYKEGIVLGLSDTVFAPNQNITREQTAVMLHAYAKHALKKDLTYADDLSAFQDADHCSEWASQALCWAVKNGIIAGRNGDRIAPKEHSTRAELATMLMKYRVRFLGEEIGNYNPYLYSKSVIQGYPSTRNDYWFGTQYDSYNRPSESVRFQSAYGEKFNALSVGSYEYKTIYLTFDEGYENGYTPAILDTLKKKNVQAVFFVTYPFVKENPALVRRMIQEGHIVGSHSTAHPADGMPSLGIDGAQADLEKVQDLVRDQFDYEMTLFRYPAGIYSEQTLALTKSMGLKSVFWSFAHGDWDPNSQPAQGSSLQKLKQRLHPGAVYLLHAVSSTNTAILGDFIDYAKSQGYTFSLIVNN